MEHHFRNATFHDAATIAEMVVQLTNEISARTGQKHFDISLEETTRRARSLMETGVYGAVIAGSKGKPVAVATFTESFALYAAGKIGIIQEFYVAPDSRSHRVGASLLEQVREHGVTAGWACIELCTPPLPEFERTLSFYRANGLVPVGGRKMRQSLAQGSGVG
jgi:GNAT superfamily N-acetyltransferase